MSQNNSLYKILIYTNDQVKAELLENILDSSVFNVTIANTQDTGFQAVHNHDPDAIIIYANSSKNIEIEICKNIRTFSNIPILVLSAVSKPGMVEKILNAGADEYLLKPVSEKILTAYLKNLSRRSRVEKDAKNRLTAGV